MPDRNVGGLCVCICVCVCGGCGCDAAGCEASPGCSSTAGSPPGFARVPLRPPAAAVGPTELARFPVERGFDVARWPLAGASVAADADACESALAFAFAFAFVRDPARLRVRGRGRDLLCDATGGAAGADIFELLRLRRVRVVGAGGWAGVFERARRGRGRDSGAASWTGTSAGDEELEEECGYASSVASAMTGLMSGRGSTFG